MDEKFIVVWTIDGETTSIPHSTQDEALQQAEKLLREHGCDLEITLHLDDEISPPPSIWFNKKRMQQWCLAGIPSRPNFILREQDKREAPTAEPFFFLARAALSPD